MRTAVLHPHIKARPGRRVPELALAEAVNLARAMDVEVLFEAVVPVSRPLPGTLFGTGRLETLRQQFADDEIGLVVVDGPLSPVQQRNLEKRWNVKVLDRTGLILEIFGARAATREGVLQVELAQLSYQKTRLVRSWTHLERQRGGLGTVGGPGESQLEADRRQISEAIDRIRAQLQKVVRTRALHRAARKKIPFPIVALAGYTNAGKSTIFNRLTGADVLAQDMLFATLDPTMRGVVLPSGQRIILSDTVGFISDLPHQLVAAFRATLEEVLDADLVVHVRDISHPESREQAADVNAILADLGISERQRDTMIEVWNKLDLLPEDTADALRARAEGDPLRVAVSAQDGTGLDNLLAMIDTALADPVQNDDLTLAFSEGRRRAWLFAERVVEQEQRDEDGYHIKVRWTDRQKERFARV